MGFPFSPVQVEIYLQLLVMMEFFVSSTLDETKLVSYSQMPYNGFWFNEAQSVFVRVESVSQATKRYGYLNTVMFSPTEPSVIAMAGWNDGTIIYDIRNLSKFVLL